MNPQDPICPWTGHGIAKLHLRVECSKELWVFQKQEFDICSVKTPLLKTKEAAMDLKYASMYRF